ncbi:non-ribosomal peptide synthetase [Wenjunlia tyrosinilytica]|uniref:Carrier domain-containing protein n=1 Tax=Wenjunlia tyrosinilytica TaxID=1544741 RepID=A0A918E0C8_9ACTN|nr:amino acid adenylation domain-containing protein [Wenjunlia tyrosinilytica]GGO94197.1 hypothetical protein GCM10012280_48480 [Wenjunlia tyrosinilytica]
MAVNPDAAGPAPTALPLSAAQQDVLVSAALDGTSHGLARQARIGLPAGSGQAEVRTAWHRLLAARPVLAARLTWDGERPTQVPGATEPPFTTSDGPGAAERDLREGFPAELDGPLLRLLWLPDSAEAVLTYHPLLLDDLAAHLLLGDLAAVAEGGRVLERPCLDAYLSGLPEHQDGASPEEVAFWKAALAEVSGPAPLFAADDERSDRSTTVRVELSSQETAAVRELAWATRSCVLRLTAASWASVVARFRNEPLAVVGLLVDTRPPGLKNALGPFERVLPAPFLLDGTSTAAWLTDRSEWMEKARELGHLPGAALNDLTGAERSVALYDSVVDARDDAVLPPTSSSTAPLHLGVEDSGDTLALVAGFDPAVTDADHVERLVRCTAAVLTGAAATPDKPIDTLPLVGARGLAAPSEHNATAVAYPSDRCLHQLVEEQVDRTPDRTALVFDGQSLDYGEMERRANRLANHLVDLGVVPGTIVGLCAEPGFALNIAILAILKAGGAYAPLDPSFPPDRLHYLAEDLDCPVVLVESHLIGKLPSVRGVVALDEPALWAHCPDTRPETGVRPGDLAYVMYTSGSTGRPKGVLIEHGGAVNFVWWISHLYPLGPEDAALQWTAYSFDAAVWELFWPLFVGARAILAPPRLHLDLNRFTELIRTERVTTLHFVPAMLQTFLTAEDAGECHLLRYVFASGEPIPTTLADRFHELLDAELINLYGVTEVSIDSTYYVVPRGADLPFIRSGRPINNTATHVLDRNLEPVPYGARGEVYIGGDSVTRGYLGRPGLTADRFIPDPFGGGGRRLYRTGDVALLLPDGHLHFLGRSDHQVKIRGIRIELLEVEAEITEHPKVRECLVVPWGEGSERSLAAYVVPSDDSLDAAELRAFLATRVPSYMVPTSVSLLDAFPLGPTGKIERKALPRPESSISEQLSHAVPPRTETERAVAAIWQEVLGLPNPGVLDDFFSVGGNSLLATRVIAAVRRRFGVRLPLRAWLESSAIADLAAAIDRHRDAGATAQALLAEVAALPDDEVGG